MDNSKHPLLLAQVAVDTAIDHVYTRGSIPPLTSLSTTLPDDQTNWFIVKKIERRNKVTRYVVRDNDGKMGEQDIEIIDILNYVSPKALENYETQSTITQEPRRWQQQECQQQLALITSRMKYNLSLEAALKAAVEEKYGLGEEQDVNQELEQGVAQSGDLLDFEDLILVDDDETDELALTVENPKKRKPQPSPGNTAMRKRLMHSTPSSLKMAQLDGSNEYQTPHSLAQPSLSQPRIPSISALEEDELDMDVYQHSLSPRLQKSTPEKKSLKTTKRKIRPSRAIGEASRRRGRPKTVDSSRDQDSDLYLGSQKMKPSKQLNSNKADYFQASLLDSPASPPSPSLFVSPNPAQTKQQSRNRVSLNQPSNSLSQDHFKATQINKDMIFDSPTLNDDHADFDDGYEVRDILRHTTVQLGGKRISYYLVDWVCDWEGQWDPTWEKEEDISPESIETYWQKARDLEIEEPSKEPAMMSGGLNGDRVAWGVADRPRKFLGDDHVYDIPTRTYGSYDNIKSNGTSHMVDDDANGDDDGEESNSRLSSPSVQIQKERANLHNDDNGSDSDPNTPRRTQTLMEKFGMRPQAVKVNRNLFT